MARRKNYYSSSNKKTKEGAKIFEAFIKVGILGVITISKMLIHIAKHGYEVYKNRRRKI